MGKGKSERKAPRRALGPEALDLALLAICLAFPPLLWWAALGWSPSRIISGHDALAGFLPLLGDVVRAGGDWTRVLYRAGMMGGIKVHDVNGTPWIFDLFGLLGVSAPAALNLLVFYLQGTCAYLGIRAIHALAPGLERPLEGSKPRLLALIALLSFAPVLAWRISYGHYFMLFGALGTLAAAALIAAARARRMTATLGLVAAGVFVNALTTCSQQLNVYGALFGGPFLIALAWGASWRELSIPLGLVVSSILVSLPKLAGMIHHAVGSDAGRGLGGPSLIYSLTEASARDWLQSLPWSDLAQPADPATVSWHERNLPIGPWLALLALPVLPRGRRLLAALAGGGLVAILFSANVPGVATALTAVVPVLKSFRVPERAFLPVAVLLPILAGAQWLAASAASARATRAFAVKAWGGALALCALLVALPGWAREAVAWAVAAGAVMVAWRPEGRARLAAASGAALAVLAVASVLAFQERLIPYTEASRIAGWTGSSGQAIRARHPQLSSPLERVGADFALQGFEPVIPYLMGLSSLNGYWNAPARLLRLEMALSGTPYNPAVSVLALGPRVRSFEALRQLYNIRLLLKFDGTSFTTEPAGESAGAAWFSAGIERVVDFEGLAAALRAQGAGLSQGARARLELVESDEAVRAAALPTKVAPECARATAEVEPPRFEDQELRVRVSSPSDCPLTVAVNYAEDLEARVTAGGGAARQATLFPAFGALAGVWIPAGTTEVLLRPRAYRPLALEVLGWLGLAGLIGALFLAWRSGREPETPVR